MTSETKKSYIHFIIGTIIMLAFRFFPEGLLPNVTPVGYQILGIFIGTIYLWSTIDPLTSSLYAVVMLAFSDYAPAGAILKESFGNPTVVQMFFMMVFMAGLTERKLTVYIARWLMTRKIVEGRPWVFTFIMMLGTLLMATFIGAFAPIFLFWPVLYDVFQDVGFKKTDKYPKMMLIAIVVSALVGFPIPPYMSNGLALLGNYRSLLPNFPALQSMENILISDAAYFIGCFSMGVVILVLILLTMKFILRPDVTPLKSVTIEMLDKNPLPPMNKSQKIYGVTLCAFIFFMLVPTLLPSVPFFAFVKDNSVAVAAVAMLIVVLLKDEEGAPVLRIGPVMGKHMSWPTYFLCLSAIILGSVLTNESTGITPFLNAVLGPIFNGMSGTTFTVVLLIISILLTNISNSLVIGMILQPVVLTFCAANGVNPAPIISLLTFTVLMTAACTPAASPFAAIMFGNKEWLTAKDVYKYATVMVLVEAVFVLLIGIPYMNLLV